MNRQRFQRSRGDEWKNLNRTVRMLEDKKTVSEPEVFPKQYQRACRDLALAKYRMYGSAVINPLNELVIRGHRFLYRSRKKGFDTATDFVLHDLPLEVQKEQKLFWFTHLVFWIPFLLLMLAAFYDPQWVYAVLGPAQTSNLEMMYGTNESIGSMRRADGENFKMFGFYILNNIGIDFKIFAGGIAFGLGTVFFLLINGLQMGGATGYMHMAGHTENFYGFVSGHSALELTGMVLSGVAGFKLGLALLNPGNRSRIDALRAAAKIGIRLLIGAAIMTFLAAIIEGFWSASGFPPLVKYTVGILGWITLYLYLFIPRNRNRMEPSSRDSLTEAESHAH